MRALIIGCGEVGTAIAACYARAGMPVDSHDPLRGLIGDLDAADVVHVCVPAPAAKLAVLGCPETALTLVHSTTLPGTCDEIGRDRLVHAPVEGRHPNLVEHLRRWAMPVSGPPEAVGPAVARLRLIGIPAEPWPGPRATTELAKHLSTLRLGVDVAFLREAHRLCARLGVPFERVYTAWTSAYNDLYFGTAMERPILEPAPGPVGGHCVGPNAAALAMWAVGRGRPIPFADLVAALLEDATFGLAEDRA